MGWVISLSKEWEDYSNYFKEGEKIFMSWATAPFLAFYGWPHHTYGCVI